VKNATNLKDLNVSTNVTKKLLDILASNTTLEKLKIINIEKKINLPKALEKIMENKCNGFSLIID